MKYIYFGVLAVILGGCSTAGPFITNISSDGRGGLNIEKCKLYFETWKGTVSNYDCRASSIQMSFHQAHSNYVRDDSSNKEQQVRALQQQNLPYDEYQRRYQQIMGQ